MATPRLAPLKFWGKCTFLVFFLVLSLPNMARTEPTHTVPLLFDARDRLPGADLSALTRLRFVTTVDFPPFNFMDQTGRLAGFQVRTEATMGNGIPIKVIGKRPGETLFEELFYNRGNAMPTVHPKILRADATTIASGNINVSLHTLHEAVT